MSNDRDRDLHHVDANGLRFCYFEVGAGPLALLLHGFPDTPHGWSGLMPALADAGYRVVAPFARGYAPTAIPGTKSTSQETLADDALALIEALGHESAVLIGHDWGAATGYVAAAKGPEPSVEFRNWTSMPRSSQKASRAPGPQNGSSPDSDRRSG